MCASQIERNMHATVRTPRKTRSELARHVHQPQLVRVDFPVDECLASQSALLQALLDIYEQYNIMQDPYVKALLQKQQKGVDVTKQLQELKANQKTYCFDQLRILANKSNDMMQELGKSAVEWYLHQCMAGFCKQVSGAGQFSDWSDHDKQYLLTILGKLPFGELSPCPALNLDHLSRKVKILIEVLMNEVQDNPDFTGLVFVEQRIWIAVIAEILVSHPRTSSLFRVGTFLGTSQMSARQASIAALPEPKNRQTTLDEFRSGKLNLILATSVLEEGIDVSNCHMVVCLERPKNLKSFVQRRGRARMQKSKYFIFTPDLGDGQSPEAWEELEGMMKRAYLDEMRQINLANEVEMDEEGSRCFEVKNTGARMTLDDALPHLNHFCAVLASGPYVAPRPQFNFVFSESDDSTMAEVTLPTSIDRAVRRARSLNWWRTEKMARKDAAFEAYKALYHAGLVNDNLLPVRQGVETFEVEFQVPDRISSTVISTQTLDPWRLAIQRHQKKPREFFRTLVKIQATQEEAICIDLLTVTPIPTVSPIELYWNTEKTYTVTTSESLQITLSETDLITLASITRKILISVHAGRMQVARNDFLWFLAPHNSTGFGLDFTKLAKWDEAVTGCQAASSIPISAVRMSQRAQWGLLSQHGDNRKYFLQSVSEQQDGSSEVRLADSLLQVIRVPKRRDFLHRVANVDNTNVAYTRVEVVSPSNFVVENLPTPYAMTALLLPSVIHRIEVAMIADSLRTTLLLPIDINVESLPLLETALTASSTHGENNYQRLEFLGDCILKFISSLHMTAENPTWPESLLTGKKGKIVSNDFLAQATLAVGLDKFILTKRFTGAKWSPRYVQDISTNYEAAGEREISSKVLADVIESLIGVGYVLGGLLKAFTCVQILLSLEKWMPIPEANSVLYQIAPTDHSITNLDILQPLIGYEFGKKALLMEALTHASYNGPNAHSSYERLEFLGDAVLDYIITRRLYTHEPSLAHQKMHAMRTAMANAAFLAFCVVETTTQEETFSKLTLQVETHPRALWQFLRYGSSELSVARDMFLQQHSSTREQLLYTLQNENEFPWHLLALMNAPKFLSDIVESVLGAIYVDSQGDFSACESFVRRLGILDCLERILSDEVDCLHPKERLGHLAVDRSVQYVPVSHHAGSKSNLQAGNRTVWRCQVKVGEEDVGGVVDGLTRLNAETIAAWRANMVIRGTGSRRGNSGGDDLIFDADKGAGV